MKKSLLLSAAALCTLGMMAADMPDDAANLAPQYWRFDQMAEGSAEAIFRKDMASCAWGGQAPYRGADDGLGGVFVAMNGLNGQTGQSSSAWTDVEGTFAAFEPFYDASRIVKLNFTETGTGETWQENVLCIVGDAAPEAYRNYAGGTPWEVSSGTYGNTTLFWLSGNEDSQKPMAAGRNYRISWYTRVITDLEQAQIQFQIGTSHWDGIDQNTGLADGGYRTAYTTFYGGYKEDWMKTVIDVTLNDNSASDYKELPIVIKMNLINVANASTILFRSPRIEVIDNIDDANVPGAEVYQEYTDKPATTSVESVLSNDVVVTAANGGITVIDADAAIEVYNLSGAMVKKVAAPATVETIDMEGANGVYVVKVGGTAKKVIL